MKIGQQLAMTPQLQQAIKLLQLSTLELQTEIQQALESNPMLEVQEESDDSSEKEAAKMRSENERESDKQEAEAEAKKENDEDFSTDDLNIESLEDFAEAIEVTDATPLSLIHI